MRNRGHRNPPETGPTTLYEPTISTSWELTAAGPAHVSLAGQILIKAQRARGSQRMLADFERAGGEGPLNLQRKAVTLQPRDESVE